MAQGRRALLDEHGERSRCCSKRDIIEVNRRRPRSTLLFKLHEDGGSWRTGEECPFSISGSQILAMESLFTGAFLHPFATSRHLHVV